MTKNDGNQADKQKESTQYLSSDESQPMNAEAHQPNDDERESKLTDRDVRSALRTRATRIEDEPVVLPEILANSLPPETRENLERVLTRTRKAFNETQAYVRTNPGEAAGLVACSGAVLWALFGTKPGRRLVDLGAPALNRYIAEGINATFGLKGPTLQ